jgi:hypothetical protein
MRTKVRIAVMVLTLSLFFGASLFSGCQPRVKSDISLKTHIPCAPPCWQNIIPGVSNADDVRLKLESNPFVEISTIKYSIVEEIEPSLIAISWQAPGKDYIYLQNGIIWQMEGRHNFIYLRGGKVLRIEVGLNGEITLAEIIEKYGPPERVYARVGAADFYWYHMAFDYPAYGLRLRSFSPVNPKEVESGTISVVGEMRITEACYYAPVSSLEEALREIFLLTPDQIAKYMVDSQEWQGFVSVPIANW